MQPLIVHLHRMSTSGSLIFCTCTIMYMPSPVTITVKLGVSLILIFNLSNIFWKKDFVITPFEDLSLSFCHCFALCSFNSFHTALFGILVWHSSMVLPLTASFARWSARSFPRCPACALIQLNSTIYSCCSISMTLVLICSMICVCFFWFCSSFSVIRLSVYTGTVFSSAFEYCIYSNAFRIAICSA